MNVQNNEHVKEIYEHYVKDLKEEIQQLDFGLEAKNKINVDIKLEAVDTLKKILREMQESLKQMN